MAIVTSPIHYKYTHIKIRREGGGGGGGWRDDDCQYIAPPGVLTLILLCNDQGQNCYIALIAGIYNINSVMKTRQDKLRSGIDTWK